MTSPTTLLTEAQVCAALGGVSRVSLWRWVRAGRFPAPIKLGAGHMTRWLSRDLDRHIEDRAAARDAEMEGAQT